MKIKWDSLGGSRVLGKWVLQPHAPGGRPELPQSKELPRVRDIQENRPVGKEDSNRTELKGAAPGGLAGQGSN